MIVVTYLLRQSITLYKNLGGLEQNLGGGLEPLSPIASAATALQRQNSEPKHLIKRLRERVKKVCSKTNSFLTEDEVSTG